MAYTEEDYQNEYVIAYEGILKQSMESFAEGNDTPMEKLFTLIDSSAEDTTAIEKLSLKKDAYMTLLASVTAQSQQTALQIVDKKFKMHSEIKLLTNQVDMSNIDTANKQRNVDADYAQKQKMIDQVASDIAFNNSKKIIMEHTRKDNVRIKATEQYAEFLKYISAADVVPAKGHFDNLVGLVKGINDGISSPDSVYAMASISGKDTDVK